jgi:ACR3 family arsenite efflux pump ArsB
MYIRKVLAIYFEVYNKHCYTNKVITTIDDISYISLHVYVPIHFDIFCDYLVAEGCNILTHYIPSNVFYYISENEVSVEGDILTLLGNGKKYYIEYFGCNDIIEKMV